MKNIRIFLSDFFLFLVVKFSIYLNRCVFVMAIPFPKSLKVIVVNERKLCVTHCITFWAQLFKASSA